MSSPHKSLGSETSAHPTLLTWCAVRRAGVLLVLAFFGLTAIWSGLGLLVTGPLATTWLTPVDQDAVDWLVERRTPTLDRWSDVGEIPADTTVKVVATAIIAAAMFIAWRSWREPALVCFSLILEAAVFITVTSIVGRPRPSVNHLDPVSVHTSFPSGHAAAATAYSAIAIVVFERTRNRWIRGLTVLLAAAVTLIVAVSRIYRGVHYPTDVVAGILLGLACIGAVYLIIRICFEQPAAQRGRFPAEAG